MKTVARIVSNRPCHPIGSEHGYSAEQWGRLLQHDVVVIPHRCLLGAIDDSRLGANARMFAGQLRDNDVDVCVYDRILHHPEDIGNDPWIVHAAEREYGPPLEGAVRFVNDSTGQRFLYSDPRVWNSKSAASGLVGMANAIGARWVLLDHAQTQFTGEGAEALNDDADLVDYLQAGTWAHVQSIRDAIRYRSLNLGIILNGSWALSDTGWYEVRDAYNWPRSTRDAYNWPRSTGGPASGVHIERMGGHWYDPDDPELARQITAHLTDHDGPVWLDPRRGGKTVGLFYREPRAYFESGVTFSTSLLGEAQVRADNLNSILATHWAAVLGDRCYVVRREEFDGSFA